MKKTLSMQFCLLTLCISLILAVFGGCGKKTEPPASDASSAQAAASAAEAEETSGKDQAAGLETISPAVQIDPSYNVAASSPVTLPLTEETKEFSWFMEAPNTLGTLISDVNENYSVQVYEEKTNVHFNFNSPASDAASTTFNLLVAANDFPDVNSGVYDYYTGGLDSAVEENVIIDLADYVYEYTPNYTRFLDAFDQVAKAVRTDTGKLWCFACISIDNPIEWGPMVRTDWLDEAGLDMPVTVDDWEEALLAFKENGHPNALLLNSNGFMGLIGSEGGLSSAFNVTPVAMEANNEFYNVDGTLHFSPSEDNYRQYLTRMADWYEKDLIYRDFTSQNDLRDIICQGNVGFFDFNAGDIANMSAAIGVDNCIAPIALPVLDANNPESHFYCFVKPASGGLCIGGNVTDEDLPILLNWFNYHYSDEGAVIANYGKEGVTFEYDENNMPQFTEMVYKNEDPSITLDGAADGWTMKYMGAIRIWQATRDVPGTDPLTLEAADIWAKYDADYVLPMISLTADESDDVSSKQADIETYVNEYTAKCIVGTNDIDATWDDYVASLNSMGLEHVVQVYQGALDRYMSR